ncbi:MAG: hypothetical protein WC547_07945 [Candidatus Omnitrophota bacterium]
MSIPTRTVLTVFLLIMPFFSTAYPEPFDKAEPIAQVYEVQGNATVKISADNSIIAVKKGCLLAAGDSLTLDKNASVAMYFKSGGRKEVLAPATRSLYKVADLLPKAEAYNQSVPLFGATRGLPQAVSQASGFFFPQEAVIVDSPPLVECTLFHGSGEVVAPGKAAMQIVQNSVVVDSKKFNSLGYGVPCVYEPQKLHGQTEYKVELRLELEQGLGNIAISFPLYIAGTFDTGSVTKYAPFSDPVYRSVETTAIDHKGKKRAITAIKQLVRRGVPPQPVIVIELFIP